MASFCRSAAPPRREWTVEDAARFAALKDSSSCCSCSLHRQAGLDGTCACATARRLRSAARRGR
eukprot:2055404-Prymnesium_polylepis.1